MKCTFCNFNVSNGWLLYKSEHNANLAKRIPPNFEWIKKANPLYWFLSIITVSFIKKPHVNVVIKYLRKNKIQLNEDVRGALLSSPGTLRPEWVLATLDVTTNQVIRLEMWVNWRSVNSKFASCGFRGWFESWIHQGYLDLWFTHQERCAVSELPA